MKAIAYTKESGEHIIEIENGKSYTSSDGEALSLFITRIQKDFESDYLEDLEVDVQEEPEVFILAKPGRPEGRKTLEEVMEEVEIAKANKGKEITFLAYRTKEVMTGKIKYVWVDKREPMAMYRIGLENGKEMNKLITSRDITIFD